MIKRQSRMTLPVCYIYILDYAYLKFFSKTSEAYYT